MNYFEKVSTYKHLQELVNPQKKYNRTDEMRKLEGSCFGCPIYGFVDGVLIIFQKLLARYCKDNRKLMELFSIFEKAEVNNLLVSILINLN